MKKQIMMLALSAGVVVVAGQGCAPGGTDLTLKWEVGKKYLMRIQINQVSQTTTPSVPGTKAETIAPSINQIMTMNQEYSIAVPKELAGGGRQLEVELGDQVIDSILNGQKLLSFDSRKPESADSANPMSGMLRKLVGLRLGYETASDGSIQKAPGFEAVLARVGSGPEQEALKQLFNEDTLKQYGDFSGMLPQRRVKVGDRWPYRKELKSTVGVLVMETTYTFAGLEEHNDRQCVRLEFSGDIKSTPGTGMTKSVARIENGQISGTAWFDPSVGFVVESVGDQVMTIKVAAAGGDLNSAIKQKVRFVLRDVKPL